MQHLISKSCNSYKYNKINYTERDVFICLTKKRYLSKKAAFEKNTRSYKCPVCFCWHKATIKKIHKKHLFKDIYRLK